MSTMRPLGPSSTPQELSVILSSVARLVLFIQGSIELDDEDLNLHLHVVQSALAGATTAALKSPRRVR